MEPWETEIENKVFNFLAELCEHKNSPVFAYGLSVMIYEELKTLPKEKHADALAAWETQLAKCDRCAVLDELSQMKHGLCECCADDLGA